LGAGDHAVIVADNSAEPRQLILTANQDTIYMSGLLDLTKGPMVVELCLPAAARSALDCHIPIFMTWLAI
jgi:hypothetical protein